MTQTSFQPGQDIYVKLGNRSYTATFTRYQGNKAEVLDNKGNAQLVNCDEICPKDDSDGPASIVSERPLTSPPATTRAASENSNPASDRSQTPEPGCGWPRRDTLQSITEGGSASESWADINEQAAASSSYADSEPSAAPEDQTLAGRRNSRSKMRRLNDQTPGRHYDEDGNELPEWLGPRDRILVGYTKMWYYNKYWGYVEPFEDGSRDVFLHGGKVVNSKKNVTKAQKKRERGAHLEDNSKWIEQYGIVPKLVRYQKVLMTDFFMNTEEKEGRRLAANTIVIVDGTWNKTKALNEVKRYKGVKTFEDKKHGIERELWQVGDECLGRWKDGELYPAVITSIKKATYPALPQVQVEWSNHKSHSVITFQDIEITTGMKRSLDSRRSANSNRSPSDRQTRSSISSDDSGSSRGRRRRGRKSSGGERSHDRKSSAKSKPANSDKSSPLPLARPTAFRRNQPAVSRNGTSATPLVRPNPRRVDSRLSASAPGWGPNYPPSSAPTGATAGPTKRRLTPPGFEHKRPQPAARRVRVPMSYSQAVAPPRAQRQPQLQAQRQRSPSPEPIMRMMPAAPASMSLPRFSAPGNVPMVTSMPCSPTHSDHSHHSRHSAQSRHSAHSVPSVQANMQQPMPVDVQQMVPRIQLPAATSPAPPMSVAMQMQMQQNAQWQMQNFQYKPPISGYNHGTIATWVLDPQGRWLCRGCGSKNCCTISNCQHCGGQREITLIPVNQMNMTPVQLNSQHGSPVQYQLPVYDNGRLIQQNSPPMGTPMAMPGMAMPVNYSQSGQVTAIVG